MSKGPEMLSSKLTSFENAVVRADISEIATVFIGLFPKLMVVLLKSPAVWDAVEHAPPLPATHKIPWLDLICLRPSMNVARFG
jgi:hypothetical protein